MEKASRKRIGFGQSAFLGGFLAFKGRHLVKGARSLASGSKMDTGGGLPAVMRYARQELTKSQLMSFSTKVVR